MCFDTLRRKTHAVLFHMHYGRKRIRIPNEKGLAAPSGENAGFYAVSLRSVTAVLIGIRISREKEFLLKFLVI
jgi:hypothetical protein